jgi:hypothetical protein
MPTTGHGLAESTPNSPVQTEFTQSSHTQFAPNPTGFSARLRRRLGRPLKIAVPRSGPIGRVQLACSVGFKSMPKSHPFRNPNLYQEAVSTSLGHTDNEKFLEHFRYLLVASNLLNEQSNRASCRLPGEYGQQPELHLIQWSIQGVLVVISFPAFIAWLIRWTLSSQSGSLTVGRLMAVLLVAALAVTILRAHVSRQSLQSLRQRAVKNASVTLTNLQALDQSISAAINLVREVELVARGYRLSGIALPPVSRLDDNQPASQSRRCLRLRRMLCRVYLDVIPSMIDACQRLEQHVLQDDLEKYLDIHEISVPDVSEAFTGAQISEIDDQESLSALRSMQWRFETLRKVFICSLLALPANGNSTDVALWKTAVDIMGTVASTGGEWSEQLNDILKEDEQVLTVPTTPSRNTPEKERFRMQLRKANELSSELRSMQAKLHILRDDVSRILEGQGNINAIAPLFNSQADNIGYDLKILNHTYDSWRTSLLPAMDRDSRRRSRPSSELRSPVSLGGLTVVDEHGGPSDALRALIGESSGSGSSPAGSIADEEVFEAIALPRLRRTLTREEKIAKLQDEEVRRAVAREQRKASDNMVRELETVINTRYTARTSTSRTPQKSRITSI